MRTLWSLLSVLAVMAPRSCHTADKTYECSVQDGKKRGTGSFTTEEGDEYVGQLTEGKPHGQGFYRFADGSSYEGDFHEGRKHGNGTYIFSNGDVYDGGFQFDKGHGYGRLRYKSGARYLGVFEADKRHGFGIHIDGQSTYRGEFMMGKKHGKGVISFTSRDKGHHVAKEFMGEFKDNQPDGLGLLTFNFKRDRFLGRFSPESPPFGQLARTGILWGQTVKHTGYLGGEDLPRDHHKHAEAADAAIRARSIEHGIWGYVTTGLQKIEAWGVPDNGK